MFLLLVWLLLCEFAELLVLRCDCVCSPMLTPLLSHLSFVTCCLSIYLPLAHKLYPCRIRVLNLVTSVAQWITISYIPIVRKLLEPAAADRGRVQRYGVLQRVLYAALREFESCSHIGMRVRYQSRTLNVFGRVLCYLCDRPEERCP